MENFSNKRRGRPRRLDQAWESFLRTIWPELKSGRSIQNRAYMTRAVKVLGNQAPRSFDWLYCKETETLQTTLLAELGRIRDDDALRVMAETLCRNKPRVTDGVREIREFRRRIRRAAILLLLSKS